MKKPKIIPFGFLALSLVVYLLASAMSCSQVQAPLAPTVLTPLPATPLPTATPAATATRTPTPAVSPSPTPEGHFQNFELGNGTPGLYYQDFGSASSVFTSQVYTGTRALQTTIGAVAAGWVRIYPGAASINVLGYSDIYLWVFDQIGEQQLDLTLTDGSGVSRTSGSVNITNPGAWTMIRWSMSNFTDMDLADIVHGTIQPGIAATFIFDDLGLANY